MRPDTLKTKIFLDGGDPGETRSIIKAMFYAGTGSSRSWGNERFIEGNYKYDASQFKPIPYREIDGKMPWREIRFKHELI